MAALYVLLAGTCCPPWGTHWRMLLNCSCKNHPHNLLVPPLLQPSYLYTGGILQALALTFNLGPMGNAINLWLNIEPAELFLFGFLPPLLLESSMNIEFFLFRKVLAKVITFAFLVVLGSTALMVPWLLFGLGLHTHWTWVQVALFVAIIASTDAVTVNALLKSGGGPDEMVVLLEGESLYVFWVGWVMVWVVWVMFWVVWVMFWVVW